VNIAAITICVAFQQLFVIVYFVIYSVRKFLDTPLHEGIIGKLCLSCLCPSDSVPKLYDVFPWYLVLESIWFLTFPR
jgi:hypothetical protein